MILGFQVKLNNKLSKYMTRRIISMTPHTKRVQSYQGGAYHERKVSILIMYLSLFLKVAWDFFMIFMNTLLLIVLSFFSRVNFRFKRQKLVK